MKTTKQKIEENYYDTIVPAIGMALYYSTSLRLWGSGQHINLYLCKNGKVSYTRKPLEKNDTHTCHLLLASFEEWNPFKQDENIVFQDIFNKIINNDKIENLLKNTK